MEYKYLIMVYDSIDTSQLDHQKSFLSKLAKQYKQPYTRRSLCAGDPDSYLDSIIRDIKEMRRDCLEAASLAKKFLKSYETITTQQAKGDKLRVKLEDRLNDMNTELAQANREIGYRENRIELLERELAESEHSYKTLYHEHTKSKRTIQHLRKELDSIERVNHKKDVVESIQRHLLNFELYKENKEKVEQLQALLLSKEAELQAIIARLDQLEAKLMNEVSINEKNKLIIAQLTSENEEYKREAEEYRIKHKISEEILQNYEMEITQFRAMISNLDKSKGKFSGLSISDVHFEDFVPILESPRTTPSLGDMFDEKEFEQREDTPVMMLVTRRNQIKTPTAFKFEHLLKEDLKVHACESVVIEGKKEVDRSNLKFKIEVTNNSKVDIEARRIQTTDLGIQTLAEMRNMQNQCGISITPERRMHEVCTLDNCLVDIQNSPGIKPVLWMKKDSVSYSIVCEDKSREYKTVRKGEITIPSVEGRRPNLEIENGMYASFIDISSRKCQFSLYKSPAFDIEPINSQKSLKIQSEQQLSIQSIKKKPKIYARRSLNSATASGRSIYTYNPDPIFTRNPYKTPKSNSHFRTEFSPNSSYTPIQVYTQQQLSPRPFDSQFIPSSPHLTTHNESIIEILPLQPNSNDYKPLQQSSEFIMEIVPSKSNKRYKTLAQSALDTQVSEDGDTEEHHHKNMSAMTMDSSILLYQEDYSNSLISYEDIHSSKSEISSKSRRSRTGTQSCGKCIIF